VGAEGASSYDGANWNAISHSHITGGTSNIQHVVGRVRYYTNASSVEQRYAYPWGACRQWVLQEDQVQELQVDCGFHVVLNARSLAKSMLNRDEDRLCRRQLEG
jgi:hypothetical protein